MSTNAISCISPLSAEQAKQFGKARTSAWARSPEVLQVSVSAWEEKKFFSAGKVSARNKAWPGLQWSLEFVHGVVRHPEELEIIRSQGIKTHTFYLVLSSLCNDAVFAHKGGSGTDIAEMLAYYVKHRAEA